LLLFFQKKKILSFFGVSTINRFGQRLLWVLMGFLLCVRLGNMAWQQNMYGPGPLAVSRAVVVPAGGTGAVAAVLKADGAITYPVVFRLAAWLTHKDGAIHAGEFLIPARSSIGDILGILRHGLPVQHQVTIPEGLTGVQIAKILNAAPAAVGQVAAPPDGAVLPQTYDYTLGTSRRDILRRAERAMQTAIANNWPRRDETVPLRTPADALVLASIVQAETPLPAELPEVAAVYENRLRQGMKLQADPTVIFAASGGGMTGGVGITRADLAAPSPYNTYLHGGLPPGPICAPGIAAIQAVLHPAGIDALYFVATGLGGSAFTDDYQTHRKNVAKYRAVKAEAQGEVLNRR